MGFDNECIVNIQSLLGEYFCPVCRQLVYPSEALQAQCTHLYCKPCLPYVANSTKACPYDGYLVTEADSKPLVESNKVLADTIGKISVYCLYHRSGCTWQGPLSECTSHCSGCTFGNSPVVCNRCGVQIVHRQVQEHAQSCSGVQPQQQKPDSVQDAATTGTGAASDQSQGGVQAATTTSLAQTSQAPAASQAVPVSNQQASASAQTQAVNATVSTQEQWYQQQQQQQQYQQYYQQYPGYDPYQQHYQQYYPYQQQAVPHYQQPAQQQPQAYGQSQMQPQAQQLQSQMQPQAQQQPQVASAVHPQTHPQVASNSQQAAPTMQSQSQYQVQNQTSSHGLPHPPTQTYPPAQPYAHHPQAAQPLGQQHTQMTQYQQTNPQIQQSAPVHPQAYPHPHPQQYTHAQAQPQLQGQLPSHPNPQPPVHLPSQPTQPVNPSAPVQTQHPAANAVTGYQSYQQPQLAQNAQLRAHSMPMTGPYQQPQHPAHMQTQFPQQPTQMRPPQSHAMILNQQQVTALPVQAQPPNAPAQQVPGFAHPQQSGYPVQQRPGVLPGHHAMAQQYAQQSSFPVQGPFVQQQSSVQPQGLPQAPPQLNYQSHAGQANMGQNYAGRPPISQAAGPHAYTQPPAGPGHIRAMQPGGNQLPVSQSHPLKATNQISQSSENPGVHVNLPSKPIGEEKNSQNPDSRRNDSSLGMQSVDINHVKSESDINYTNEQKSKGETKPQLDGRELSQPKQMLGAESESPLVENGASAEESKPKVKEEVSEDRAASLPTCNPADIAIEDRKDKQPIGSGAQGIPSMFHQSKFVSQVPGSNSVPLSDHGRNPLQPLGSIPQRPAVSTAAPHNLSMTGHPPGQPRPHGPGQFPLPGQHVSALDYPNMPILKQPPTSVYSENQSSASFVRGPSNLGPGHASHVQQRNPQAETFAVPPFPPQPTATSDPHAGIMGRTPMYPSDNGPGYFDGRQPDSHFHGHMERGAYGQTPVGQSNAVKINDPSGHDRSPRLGLRDERFKLPTEELLKPYPAGPMQHPVNRREFEEDLNKFPRPSHLDSGPSSKFGGHFPSSGALDQGPRAFGLEGLPRSFENAPHGFDHDPGMKGTGTFPPRFLPPFTDAGDRHRPGGFPDDTVGRAEFGRTHPDLQRPVPGFGRHHMDGLTSRSPGREYTDPPHRFGGFSGDVDGNEFGEGSKPFDISLDSLGKPIHSRFPPPPSHFRRGEFDLRMADPLAGPLHNNLRVGDAQDMLPAHIRRGGPHGMPLGEATRFGPFGSHPQMGEPSTGGHFPPHRPLSESFGRDRPAHPRIGEPGFRSRYALDSGFLPGAMEPFDNSRKRKAGSIMCRICKLDCETVEGLDLHSQTREHQKRAMDMVLAIKQQNKKQKTPGDRPSAEDRSKSRVAGFEARTKKR